VKEPKIYQRKRYTANTPVARAVSELIDQYGGRLVLEAVADYCFQHLGVRCFAAGFGRAAEQLGSTDDHSPARQLSCSARPQTKSRSRSANVGIVS
jgi:hypothetical protein